LVGTGQTWIHDTRTQRLATAAPTLTILAQTTLGWRGSETTHDRALRGAAACSDLMLRGEDHIISCARRSNGEPSIPRRGR
jgi:hypothetical protein